MREKRSAKLANKERLQSLVLFTRFSDIKDISNDVIKDQLRTHRLQGKKGFIISHPTRVQLMRQLQALMRDSEGAEANMISLRETPELRGAVPGARRQTAATPQKNKSAVRFASTEATSGVLPNNLT